MESKHTLPKFRPEVIEDFRNDGYWVEAIEVNKKGQPDLMTFGVNSGEVFWHRNPDWERFLVAKLQMPVGMAQADITRDGNINPVIDSDLDSIIVASESGVHWLYFDERSREWKRGLIGEGERSQFEQTGYKGTGNVDVGRIGDDPFAYVVAQEPFHGNTVAVYCKDEDGPPDRVKWTRHVLDVYGDPNENGEGTGHHVVCADFDGDGDDEFLIALRGPSPWKGVFYYKAIDVRNGVFVKWRVSSEPCHP